MSASRLGKKRGPHSEETKRKIGETNRATAKRRDFSFMESPDYKLRQAERMKEIWAQRRAGLAPMPVY